MEFKQYEDNAVSLEAQIDKLINVTNKINESKGMCKTTALEALETIPTFNNKTPLAYYTDKPSIAQYHASLEELSMGVWALIVAAAAALIAMIYKFIKWLFGKGDSGSGSSQPTSSYFEESEKEHKEIDASQQKLSKEFEEIMRNVEKDGSNISYNSEDGVVIKGKNTFSRVSTEDMSDLHYRLKTIDELLGWYIDNAGSGSEIAHILREDDPLFYDVMHQREYTQTIKSTAHAIPVIPNAVSVSADKYVDMVKRVDNHIQRLRGAKSDNDPVEVNQHHILIDMFGDGKKLTIGDAVYEIVEIRNQVHENHNPNSKILFSKLNNLFLNALKNIDISNILKKIENTETHIDTLLTKITTANTGVEKLSRYHEMADPITIKYAGLLKESFRVTRIDIMDCFKFFKEIMTYAQLLQKMDIKLRNAQRAALRVIEAEVRKYGSVPSEIKEVHKQLDDLLIFKDIYSNQL